MFEAFTPRHAKRYAKVGATIRTAVEGFVRDIQTRVYPDPEPSFKIERKVLQESLAYANQTPKASP